MHAKRSLASYPGHAFSSRGLGTRLEGPVCQSATECVYWPAGLQHSSKSYQIEHAFWPSGQHLRSLCHRTDSGLTLYTLHTNLLPSPACACPTLLSQIYRGKNSAFYNTYAGADRPGDYTQVTCNPHPTAVRQAKLAKAVRVPSRRGGPRAPPIPARPSLMNRMAFNRSLEKPGCGSE